MKWGEKVERCGLQASQWLQRQEKRVTRLQAANLFRGRVAGPLAWLVRTQYDNEDFIQAMLHVC